MLSVGAAGSLADIPIMSQLAVATPDAYRSRVSSIMLFLCQGVAPLGVALAGLVLSAFGFAKTMTASQRPQFCERLEEMRVEPPRRS
ncbi:MAG: hypothetical protein DMF89_21400 [Acidobacteria bacterium]|nr:MAG: hypothetical protein DMF89_21400 [Acidobacteriota bacterium]